MADYPHVRRAMIHAGPTRAERYHTESLIQRAIIEASTARIVAKTYDLTAVAVTLGTALDFLREARREVLKGDG